MLIFGPYYAIPKDSNLVVYNLSSPNESIQRLPGLLVIPQEIRDQYDEKNFDLWYYDYVLNDPIACGSLMMILESLYNNSQVYICIANQMGFISILNESLMKLLQTRYDIKYAIVNEPEDFLYIDQDGCDFASIRGIQAFDEDLKRYRQLAVEQQLLSGGVRNES